MADFLDTVAEYRRLLTTDLDPESERRLLELDGVLLSDSQGDDGIVRRSFHRRQVELSGALRMGKRTADLAVVNLSAGGACLRTHTAELEVGDDVAIRITAADGTLAYEAAVQLRWLVSDGSGMVAGVSFIGPLVTREVTRH